MPKLEDEVRRIIEGMVPPPFNLTPAAVRLEGLDQEERVEKLHEHQQRLGAAILRLARAMDER